MNYDAYFFDMDQTLTRSKSEIDGEHLKLLLKLANKAEVIIVSGAEVTQMMKQLITGELICLAQNGNHATMAGEADLWKHYLTAAEETAIMAHIYEISKGVYTISKETVQNRGCQVSFSLVGHNADLAIKEKFDPTREKRLGLLKEFPFNHPTLTVRVGGTTCFDYTDKGGTKGANVRKLIHTMNFAKPIYIGDALFPGGNDSSVIGVCETFPVNSVEETYDFIRTQLAN